MKIYEKEKKFMLGLAYGIVGSNEIDRRLMQTADEHKLEGYNARRRNAMEVKISNDIKLLDDYLGVDELRGCATISDYQALVDCAAERMNTKQIQKITKSLRRIFTHRSWERMSEHYNNPANRSNFIAKKLTATIDSEIVKMWEDIENKRNNDRKRRITNILLENKMIGMIEVIDDLRREVGDYAYYLTEKGKDHLLYLYPTSGNLIVSYKRPPKLTRKLVHELIVTRAVRSLMTPKGLKYKVFNLVDDRGQRINFRRNWNDSEERKRYIPDLEILIKVDGNARRIRIEIDCGTHSAQTTLQRTASKYPLIYICKTEKIAYERLSQASRVSPAPVFFTTAERFDVGGLFGAGYLTVAKPSFCSCSSLISYPIGVSRMGVRDKYGCPCLLSLFVVASEFAHKSPPPKAPPSGKPDVRNSPGLPASRSPARLPVEKTENSNSDIIYVDISDRTLPYESFSGILLTCVIWAWKAFIFACKMFLKMFLTLWEGCVNLIFRLCETWLGRMTLMSLGIGIYVAYQSGVTISAVAQAIYALMVSYL